VLGRRAEVHAPVDGHFGRGDDDGLYPTAAWHSTWFSRRAAGRKMIGEGHALVVVENIIENLLEDTNERQL
jgi:hypothetical protein